MDFKDTKKQPIMKECDCKVATFTLNTSYKQTKYVNKKLIN